MSKDQTTKNHLDDINSVDHTWWQKQLIKDTLVQLQEQFTAEEIKLLFEHEIKGIASVDQSTAMQILSIKYLRNIPEYREFIDREIEQIVGHEVIDNVKPLTHEDVVNALSNLFHYCTQLSTTIVKVANDILLVSDANNIKVINLMVDSVLKVFINNAIQNKNLNVQNFVTNISTKTVALVGNIKIKEISKTLKEQNIEKKREQKARLFELGAQKALNIMVKTVETNFIKAASSETKSILKQGANYIIQKHLNITIASSVAFLMLTAGYLSSSRNAVHFVRTQLNNMNLETMILTAAIAAVTRAGYKYGWKISGGDIAFKEGDLTKIINASYTAYGLERLAKEFTPLIYSSIIKTVKAHIKNISENERNMMIIKVIQILSKVEDELEKQKRLALAQKDSEHLKENKRNQKLPKPKENKKEQRLSDRNIEPIKETKNNSYLHNLTFISAPNASEPKILQTQLTGAPDSIQRLALPASDQKSTNIFSNEGSVFAIKNITFAATTLMLIAAALKLCGFKNQLFHFDNAISFNLNTPSIIINQEDNFKNLTKLLNNDSKAWLIARMVKNAQQQSERKNWTQKDIEELVNSPNFQRILEGAVKIEASLRKATEKDFGITRSNKKETQLRPQRSIDVKSKR